MIISASYQQREWVQQYTKERGGQTHVQIFLVYLVCSGPELLKACNINGQVKVLLRSDLSQNFQHFMANIDIFLTDLRIFGQIL